MITHTTQIIWIIAAVSAVVSAAYAISAVPYWVIAARDTRRAEAGAAQAERDGDHLSAQKWSLHVISNRDYEASFRRFAIRAFFAAVLLALISVGIYAVTYGAVR